MYLGGKALLLLKSIGAAMTFPDDECTQRYFGHTRAEIETFGKAIRVIGLDQNSFIVTEDLKPNRLNVYLVDGRVVFATEG